MNLDNLTIKDSSVYCSEDRYIEIRQITGWMQLHGQRGDWYQNIGSTCCQYDICYTERQPYGDTCKYVQTPINFEDIPQYVLDYLYSHNYRHH